MRTESISIYKFDELSDAAKENAIQQYRDRGYGYAWTEEWCDSMNAFAQAAGTKVKDYEVGPYSHSFIKIEDVETIWGSDDDELTGLRLRAWIINNILPYLCKGKYYSTPGQQIDGKYHYKHRYSQIQMEYDNCPLTGFCGDQDFISPLLDFVNDPGQFLGTHQTHTYQDLLQECFDAGMEGMIADMEAQDSDEYIIDMLEANDYEFTADGTIY